MRILGIDPGTKYLGLAIVDVFENVATSTAMGTNALNEGSVQERIHQVLDLLSKYTGPFDVAMEQGYLEARRPGRSLELAQVSGAIMGYYEGQGRRVSLYLPAVIKKTITGHGNSEKYWVREGLERILRERLPAGPDSIDALAVGITHGIAKGILPPAPAGVCETHE